MRTSTADGFDVLNVVGEYFQFCDVKDWDGMRSLWTDVVTVDYAGVLPLDGQVEAETLKRAMADVIGPIPLTQHMVSSPVVTIDGDTATVRFHLEALHHHPELGDDERSTDWTLYARDVIGLDRTPRGWKVSSEKLTPMHQTGNRNFVADLTRLATGRS
ncbi:nuclear transport factor 2 family protein [Streptomyces sp. NPDC005195]|uniref:nuclear transport factor 2 family protein n=1 Tax=Streptomyces sp. NPDC005195 TaxID=3154561 RepID=UPI0033BEBD7E